MFHHQFLNMHAGKCALLKRDTVQLNLYSSDATAGTSDTAAVPHGDGCF